MRDQNEEVEQDAEKDESDVRGYVSSKEKLRRRKEKRKREREGGRSYHCGIRQPSEYRNIR